MNELEKAAKSGGRFVTLMGVISIILGMLAMMAPGLTGISILILLGLIVLIGGIVRIIWAFRASSLGRGLLMFAIGGLTILCGIILLANPIFASGVLSILLAIYFVLDGISEISAGMSLQPNTGWGWLIFGGIVSIILGVLIWSQYPLSGVWAIGILLGIKLFFVGIIMITTGSALRSAAKA